jgi:hypothetical protein
MPRLCRLGEGHQPLLIRVGRPQRTAANRALGRAPHKLASGLLLTAGATILLAIITAEALYTAPYTTRTEISDLGATDTGVILQPSSTIFNATMLVAGAMIILGAYFAHRTLGRKAVTIPACSAWAPWAWGCSRATSTPSIPCSPSLPLSPVGWRCCCRLG